MYRFKKKVYPNLAELSSQFQRSQTLIIFNFLQLDLAFFPNLVVFHKDLVIDL